eukprot:2116324-Pyramimonas_sp.AAC.1
MRPLYLIRGLLDNKPLTDVAPDDLRSPRERFVGVTKGLAAARVARRLRPLPAAAAASSCGLPPNNSRGFTAESRGFTAARLRQRPALAGRNGSTFGHFRTADPGGGGQWSRRLSLFASGGENVTDSVARARGRGDNFRSLSRSRAGSDEAWAAGGRPTTGPTL